MSRIAFVLKNFSPNRFKMLRKGDAEKSDVGGRVNKSCSVCGYKSPLCYRTPEADIYRCLQCNHCFSDLDSINGFENYGPDYYEKTHIKWFENPNFSLFEYIKDFIIKQATEEAAVLDVGCGRGDFLKYLSLSSRNLKLTGIDLGASPIVERVEFIQGDALVANFNRQFDFVISLAAIEHVTDIHVFVKRLSELCKPLGFIIIMTDNEGSLVHDMARALYQIGWKMPFERIYSKHHLNHFNVPSLKHLLQMHGLLIKKVRCHNMPLRAVDIPASSPTADMILRSMVGMLFFIGFLTKKTLLQTIVCRNGSV